MYSLAAVVGDIAEVDDLFAKARIPQNLGKPFELRVIRPPDAANVELRRRPGTPVHQQREADPVGADGKGFFYPPTLLRADDPRAAAVVHEHEVFGPVTTLMPYEGSEEAGELVALGHGGLVASLYSDDRDNVASLIQALAPWNGRLLVASKKVVDQAIAPGLVLPSCIHGGPGRAGGGEELGGLRGLDFYMQRTAVQGDRGLLERALGMR